MGGTSTAYFLKKISIITLISLQNQKNSFTYFLLGKFLENPYFRFKSTFSMLQDLIKDLQSTLRNFSKGLENKNLLVDIPWTMVDGDLNLQRLIFRKDNSLYIVKEGEIQVSKWEFLPAMNSLVIEVGGRKILMNEVFADGKALILKKDGVSMDFLSFANQNELPDLNLISHLNKLITQEEPKNNHDIQVKIEQTEGGWEYLFLAILFLVIISLILANLK